MSLDLRFEENKIVDTIEKIWTGMCVRLDLNFEENEKKNIDTLQKIWTGMRV